MVIEKQMEHTEFWQNHESAGQMSRELADLKESRNKWKEIDETGELLKMELAGCEDGEKNPPNPPLHKGGREDVDLRKGGRRKSSQIGKRPQGAGQRNS